MGMVCKGTCVRYRAPPSVRMSRYDNGQKRCQVCSIFLTWIGDSCPCCGVKLRTKSRNYKTRSFLLTSRI